MNEQVILKWVREILHAYTQRGLALLVIDSFSTNTTQKVKTELAKINTYPAIIPSGCAS